MSLFSLAVTFASAVTPAVIFVCCHLSSGESEPGDGKCVGGGGRDGDHQLSGEEQWRLRYPAAQPQQTDYLLQRHETWVLHNIGVNIGVTLLLLKAGAKQLGVKISERSPKRPVLQSSFRLQQFNLNINPTVCRFRFVSAGDILFLRSTPHFYTHTHTHWADCVARLSCWLKVSEDSLF